MREQDLAAVEAILLVVVSPISAADIGRATGLTDDAALELLLALQAEYSGASGGRRRGCQLREVAGGWRLYTNPDYADVVAGFVTRENSAKLSTAALETLAIVAYRQPVSRAQIAAIRGVSVDSVVRTLMMRGLIAEVGDRSSGAVLYGTTPFFLEIMGMNTLEELEPLAPLVPDLSELDETEQELR